MDEDDFVQDEHPVRAAYWNVPLLIWSVCAATLLLPSLMVWIVRGSAYALQCEPGPELCQGWLPFGGGLRDTLGLAWGLSTHTFALVGIAFIASLAALFARKPLLAAASLLLLPIAALVLPLVAVLSATYPGCGINEAGIGDCTLWGARQGMSFHNSATVQGLIYSFAPYSFSLALMLGILGWFFARPHHALPPPRAAAHAMHRFPRDEHR